MLVYNVAGFFFYFIDAIFYHLFFILQELHMPNGLFSLMFTLIIRKFGHMTSIWIQTLYKTKGYRTILSNGLFELYLFLKWIAPRDMRVYVQWLFLYVHLWLALPCNRKKYISRKTKSNHWLSLKYNRV